MSRSVQLVDSMDGRPLEAPTRVKGGTYSLTGVPMADLSVTGNYHGIIVDATGWEDGIRHLHGRRAGDTVPELRAAVRLLGTEQSMDYWEDTPGNVGHMFSVLLDWAQQHPDATWRVI